MAVINLRQGGRVAQLNTNETAEQLELLLGGSNHRIVGVRVDQRGLLFTVIGLIGESTHGSASIIRLKSKEGVELEVLNNGNPIGKIRI